MHGRFDVKKEIDPHAYCVLFHMKHSASNKLSRSIVFVRVRVKEICLHTRAQGALLRY